MVKPDIKPETRLVSEMLAPGAQTFEKSEKLGELVITVDSENKFITILWYGSENALTIF